MKKKICVVIPCFNVKNKILNVIKKIDFKTIDKVVVVDDNCPEKSGYYLKSILRKRHKIHFIFLKKNIGVGGATKAGFDYAIKKKYQYVIKLDGDGQHEPKNLNKIINIFKINKYDCCKGYRELSLFDLKKMPFIRFLGNVSLTMIFRIVSNNFKINDITNGLIGIKVSFLKKINLKKIKNDYFFEQDLLFHLIQKNINISQIKTKIIYENEKSSLKPFRSIIPFLFFYLKNLISKF